MLQESPTGDSSMSDSSTGDSPTGDSPTGSSRRAGQGRVGSMGWQAAAALGEEIHGRVAGPTCCWNVTLDAEIGGLLCREWTVVMFVRVSVWV